MTAEKYVKQIVKRVKCDKLRKKDIARQLLSEIDERIANGEELQYIISEMGTAEEIADGFNEGISQQEKKKYKRKTVLKILIPVLVIILVLIAAVRWYMPALNELDSSKTFADAEVESTLLDAIDLLDQGDYESLRNMATAQMADVLTADNMEAAKAQLCGDWGEKTMTGAVYTQEVVQMNQHFAVGQVNVTYENISVVYTVTFDADMKLAGLYMK